MAIGSVEGLLVSLFFVVPGGLGSALRRAVFGSQAPTAFAELLNSLANALVALLLTETLLMVVGSGREGIGDYLIDPLSRAESFPSGLEWGTYAFYLSAAILLPTLGAWLRRLPLSLWILRAVSPHAGGLDYVMHEARPQELRREEVWVTVNTHEDEAFLGQVAWRSTAPDPLEIVLSRVRDLNDPEETDQQEDWMVWLPAESIRAIWVHVPER